MAHLKDMLSKAQIAELERLTTLTVGENRLEGKPIPAPPAKPPADDDDTNDDCISCSC